jgi:hypothetical protein
MEMKWITVIFCILLLVGCGQDKSNSKPSLELVSVTPQIVSIYLNETQQLTTEAQYSDGSTVDVTQNSQWSSANSNIITVDANGIVKAVGYGNTTVRGQYQGASAVSQVIVKPTLEVVYVTPEQISMYVNETEQLTAEAYYSDGSTVDVTKDVQWSSANSNIITVDANGIVKAVESGSTMVIGQYQELSVKSQIDVQYKAYITINQAENETVIYGNKATRTVSAFKAISPLKSRVFNFKGDAIGDVVLNTNKGDDVAPIHAYRTTLLGNHSYRAHALTVTGHTKTGNDIGSTYTYSGSTYLLTWTKAANPTLILMRAKGAVPLPSNGTLIYVGGGTDTNDIVFSANNYRQFYPVWTDRKFNVFVDGIEIEDLNKSYEYIHNISFNESFYLLSYEDIYDWYASSYDGTQTPVGTKQMRFSVSYRYDVDGGLTVIGEYTAMEELLLADIMGLQSGREGTHYYIPKTLEFTHQSRQVNFSMIESSREASDNGGTSIHFTPEKLGNSPISSDRWISIHSGGYFSAMGFLPLGAAGFNRAKNVTQFTSEIRGNSDKIYPRLVDIGDFTTSIGDSWSFVGYRVVGKPQGNSTATYPVRTDDSDYYFIDYHDAQELSHITMPKDFIGRGFNVIESRNISPLDVVITSEFSIDVDCIDDYGYLVLEIFK